MLVPTRVGMIPEFETKVDGDYACPHTRGDDPFGEVIDYELVVLSPHAWG